MYKHRGCNVLMTVVLASCQYICIACLTVLRCHIFTQTFTVHGWPKMPKSQVVW